MKDGWQDRVIAGCPAHQFLDPREHGLANELMYTAWDLAAIRESDLVLAYMNAGNPSGFGLSLEVGYAFALERPVWYVCEDQPERQRYFGMVRACAGRMFDSLDAAIEALVLRAVTTPRAPVAPGLAMLMMATADMNDGASLRRIA
jgi:nucleoside 2-deoxyribosyltransferase